MTDALHARHTGETHSEGRAPSGLVFMNFQFLRLDGSYHALLPNEKVVAKQELLAAFDSSQRKVPTAAYVLTGLRSDCDLLLWRASEHVEDLQAMTFRLQSSGMGKYLVPVYSFLGTAANPDYARTDDAKRSESPKPLGFGDKRYLFVHPLICGNTAGSRDTLSEEYARLAAKHSGVRMHQADSLGLDDQDFVFAFETDTARAYVKLAHELRESKVGPSLSRETPAFTCVQRDVRDIVDALG